MKEKGLKDQINELNKPDDKHFANIVEKLTVESGGFDLEDSLYAYYLNVLAVSGFPVSKYGSSELSRKVNGLQVTIGVSNHDNEVEFETNSRLLKQKPEIPYGPASRLIVTYLIYRAKRYNQKKIYLRGTLSSLLSELGIEPQYGPGRSFDEFYKQFVNICNTYISITDQRNTKDKGFFLGENTFMVERYALWWGKGAEEGDDGVYIELSDKFFEFIQRSAMPVHWERLLRLKSNAFRIDLYMWLISKTFSHQGGQKKFAWGEFYATFGIEYVGRSLVDFKKKVKREYDGLVKQVPECRDLLSFDRKHIYLNASRPLISGSSGLDKLKNEF